MKKISEIIKRLDTYRESARKIGKNDKAGHRQSYGSDRK
jgi:hypothetical protein